MATDSRIGHTVVLGASPKPERYSNKAVALLRQKGIPVIPVHPIAPEIHGIPCAHSLSEIRVSVDTITVYLGAGRSSPLTNEMMALSPRRIILNPGAENPFLEACARESGIPVQHACTLVLLQTGQWKQTHHEESI